MIRKKSGDYNENKTLCPRCNNLTSHCKYKYPRPRRVLLVVIISFLIIVFLDFERAVF